MYHEQKPPKLRQVVLLPLFLFLVLGLPSPPSARADTEEAVRELAQKIMTVLAGRDLVTLRMQNRSSLSSAVAAAIQQALESAMQRNGVRLATEGHAGPHVSITLSETLAAYVWIAEVRRGDSSNVFMVKVGRESRSGHVPNATSLVIRRELVWEQNNPILDVAFSSVQSSPRTMAVLEPKQILFFRWQGDAWSRESAIPLPRATAAERVPRGVLNYRADVFSAAFENEVCQQNRAALFEFKCEAARQPFLAADEHLASQLAEIEKKAGVHQSWAKLDLPREPVVVLTTLDGLARIYEEGVEPVATFAGWGSELAAVQSNCGAGWQLLVTGKGDWVMPDTVQAHEIRDRTAVPVSAPAEFAGPIISLRISDDSRAALAIVRNLATHDYEAYHLSITCEK